MLGEFAQTVFLFTANSWISTTKPKARGVPIELRVKAVSRKIPKDQSLNSALLLNAPRHLKK
jgi:hypothetical protein